MYFVSPVVILIYFILFICSFGKNISGSLIKSRKGLLGIFDRMAVSLVYIVRKVGKIIGNRLANRADGNDKNVCIKKKHTGDSQVSRYLENLNPGEDISKIRENYIIQKLSLSLIVLLIGTVLGVGMKYSARLKAEKITVDGTITRSDYDGDSQTVTMQVSSGKNKETVDVDVNPRRLTSEEIDKILPEFYEKLEKAMLGENSDEFSVSSDLNPVSAIEGYPFTVKWSTSDYDLVSPGSGKVSAVSEEHTVTMTAHVNYYDFSTEREFELTLVPEELTESETYSKQIEQLIADSEENSREDITWKLPEEMNGESLNWKTVIKDNSMFIWAAVLVVSVSIFFISDADLGKKVNEKKLKMKEEYSEIVRKLALYIGAGLTVRNAFNKIAADAVNRKKNNPVYEEMMFTCRELRSGLSEEEAYEKFGRRTGVQEYIRVGTLLQQNLKKGSSNLVPRLCEEAENATVERLQSCRKRGEEAGTKLLVPMVLLLLVVMVMIMFPAFSSMQL